MIILAFLTAGLSLTGRCQLFSTRTGFAGFYSKTAMEDIKAENNQVYAIVDAGKKNLAFTMLLKGFVFAKELMQQHFNENYVESDKYPKASFSGSYLGEMLPDKNGNYSVIVKGNLTLHNITRSIETPATLEVSNGRIVGQADFRIRPEDFNISIPTIVRDKIDREMLVRIRIDCGAQH